MSSVNEDPAKLRRAEEANARHMRRALRRGRIVGRLPGMASPPAGWESRLIRLREEHLNLRRRALAAGAPARVGVGGWSLSENPVGRVLTLAEAYQRLTPEVEIFGWLNLRRGRRLWGPMRDTEIPVHAAWQYRGVGFLARAIDLVAAHPYDVVHLSKPRLHTVVLGRLYELIWGATVVMDVDDEERGFVGGGEALSLEQVEGESGSFPPLKAPHSEAWTRAAVGQVDSFEHVTVSNPALHEVYGGDIIPHVRDETKFTPGADRTAEARERFGVPQEAHVVLFFGTPRRHKGLLETAQALASLDRDDIWFVIAGEFPADEQELKAHLQATPAVRFRFLGEQPYREVPDIVALGNYAVLLQESESLVSQYQLPAKLMDALAMELVCLVQITQATEWLAEEGAVVPVSHEAVGQRLAEFIDNSRLSACQRHAGRDVFQRLLSFSSVESTLQRFVDHAIQNRTNQHSGLSDKAKDLPKLRHPTVQEILRL